jgi:hypothetical protein
MSIKIAMAPDFDWDWLIYGPKLEIISNKSGLRIHNVSDEYCGNRRDKRSNTSGLYVGRDCQNCSR